MKLHLAAGTLIIAMALGSSRALADSVLVDRYQPPPPGEPFLYNAFPIYRGDWPIAFRASVLARETLAFNANAPIDTMTVVHPMLAFGFHHSLMAYVGFPFALVQTGTPPGVAGLPFAYQRAVGGDPRLGARLRAFGSATRDPLSFHIAGELLFNTRWFGAPPATNLSDDSMRGILDVIAAGCIGNCPPHPHRHWRFRWSTTAGMHFRPFVHVGQRATGTEARLGASIGLEFPIAGPIALQVNFEEMFWVPLVAARPDAFAGVIEGSASLGLLLPLDFGIAAAYGVQSATAGRDTPAHSIMLRLTYSPHDRGEERGPRGHDTDGDHVDDSQDRCPNDPTNRCTQHPLAPRPMDIPALSHADNDLRVDASHTVAIPYTVAFGGTTTFRSETLRSLDAQQSDELEWALEHAHDSAAILNEPILRVEDQLLVRRLTTMLSRDLPPGDSWVILIPARLDPIGPLPTNDASSVRLWAWHALRRQMLATNAKLENLSMCLFEPGDTPPADPFVRFSIALLVQNQTDPDHLSSDGLHVCRTASAGPPSQTQRLPSGAISTNAAGETPRPVETSPAEIVRGSQHPGISAARRRYQEDAR